MPIRALVTTMLMVTPSVAAAHHSWSAFDEEHPISLSGVVSEMQWVSPHASLRLNVSGQTWDLQLPAPLALNAQGWGPTTLAAGKRVQVTVLPLRSGQREGAAVEVVGADGKVLFRSVTLSRGRP